MTKSSGRRLLGMKGTQLMHKKSPQNQSENKHDNTGMKSEITRILSSLFMRYKIHSLLPFSFKRSKTICLKSRSTASRLPLKRSKTSILASKRPFTSSLIKSITVKVMIIYSIRIVLTISRNLFQSNSPTALVMVSRLTWDYSSLRMVTIRSTNGILTSLFSSYSRISITSLQLFRRALTY